MRLAVIGHVEWSEFVSVDRLPAPGEILHLPGSEQAAAGGGAVAAVQLARLAGRALFFTAVGDDEPGRAVAPDLEPRGLDVRAATRPDPQRRGFVFLQPGERTIVTVGEKLVPVGKDPLGWEDLDGFDGVFFVAGDAEALRVARRARVLVATSRMMPLLREAGVHLDAVVGSGRDPAERYEPLPNPPGLVVVTAGAEGGILDPRRGTHRRLSGGEGARPDRRRLRVRRQLRGGAHVRAGGRDGPGGGARAGRRAAARRASPATGPTSGSSAGRTSRTPAPRGRAGGGP